MLKGYGGGEGNDVISVGKRGISLSRRWSLELGLQLQIVRMEGRRGSKLLSDPRN